MKKIFFKLVVSVFCFILVFNPEKSKGETIAESEINYNNYHLKEMNIIDAWEAGYTGKGVNVAVIDSGFGKSKENNSNVNIVYGQNFGNAWDSDPNDYSDNPNEQHGTNVLNVIGARHDGKGIKGIAPDSNFFVLKTGNGSFGNLKAADDVSRALKFIYDYNSGKENSKKIHIVNMSKDFDNMWFNSSAISEIKKTIEKLWLEQGVLIIVASGNDGTEDPRETCGGEISKLDSVITVASYSSDYEYHRILTGTNYSCPKEEVDISAPGSGYYSENIDNEITKNFGTSFSTPIVSGLLALYKEMFPDLSPEELKKLLYLNAKKVFGYKNSVGYDIEFGNGLASFPKKINYTAVLEEGGWYWEDANLFWFKWFNSFQDDSDNQYAETGIDEFKRIKFEVQWGIGPKDEHGDDYHWYIAKVPSFGTKWISKKSFYDPVQIVPNLSDIDSHKFSSFYNDVKLRLRVEKTVDIYDKPFGNKIGSVNGPFEADASGNYIPLEQGGFLWHKIKTNNLEGWIQNKKDINLQLIK